MVVAAAAIAIAIAIASSQARGLTVGPNLAAGRAKKTAVSSLPGHASARASVALRSARRRARESRYALAPASRARIACGRYAKPAPASRDHWRASGCTLTSRRVRASQRESERMRVRKRKGRAHTPTLRYIYIYINRAKLAVRAPAMVTKLSDAAGAQSPRMLLCDRVQLCLV